MELKLTEDIEPSDLSKIENPFFAVDMDALLS
jgi:hypothetical protein